MNKLHTFGAVCAFFDPDIVDLKLGNGSYIYYDITNKDSDFEFTVDDLMDFIVTDGLYEQLRSLDKIRITITINVKDPNELEKLIKEKHEKEKKLSDTLFNYKKAILGSYGKNEE